MNHDSIQYAPIHQRKSLSELIEQLLTPTDGPLPETAPTIPDAYVLHRAGKRGQKLRDALVGFLDLVQVADTDKNIFLAASHLTTITDLEDGFQYQTAMGNPAIEYFVTGNIKDFRPADQSQLPVITPAEMVKILPA